MATTFEQRQQQAEAFRQMRESPAAFRRYLLIDTDAGPKLCEATLDPWQRRDFESLDAGWIRVAHRQPQAVGKLRAYLERPRGHSKTADLAVMVTWALWASPRKISGIAAAKDEDQAGFLRDAIERLVLTNPWLGMKLEVKKLSVTNKETGSELEVITSDAAGAYGHLVDFIVIDELTHWPKRDLWDSLLSSAAKRANCMLAIIANAGYRDSWQWATREAIRSDTDWYFSRLEGPRASWIDGKLLGEQRRLLPAIAYNRLWLNQWTEGAGDALADADIKAAITLAAPATGVEPGWGYYAGLDLGLSRDSTALAVVARHVGHSESIAKPRPKRSRIAQALADLDGLPDLDCEYETIHHPGSGRIKLVELRLWRPERGIRVSLEEVEREILALHARFGMYLAADPWQARHLLERLQRLNVACEGIEQVGPNIKAMCSATLEAFNDRQIDIFDHPSLLADLRALRVEERAYGVRLVSPRNAGGDATKHGDTATALALALLAARRYGNAPAAPVTVEGPLLVYP